MHRENGNIVGSHNCQAGMFIDIEQRLGFIEAYLPVNNGRTFSISRGKMSCAKQIIPLGNFSFLCETHKYCILGFWDTNCIVHFYQNCTLLLLQICAISNIIICLFSSSFLPHVP